MFAEVTGEKLEGAGEGGGLLVFLSILNRVNLWDTFPNGIKLINNDVRRHSPVVFFNKEYYALITYKGKYALEIPALKKLLLR